MITINDVTKKYRDTMILEHSNYKFHQTGIVCLMGSSGGGKTTLLNLLAGFDADYEGEILVGGTSIRTMDADELCRYRKDNIGFVFQNYHLLPGYTVLENVLLSCELTEAEPEVSRQKAKALLTRLGMAEKENQKSESLSGGEKQRVAIARALINDPQIVFADEPTGALDRRTSTEIMELLREIAGDRLVVVITHDRKISDFADEIIHIKDKKIEVEQTTSRQGENARRLMRNTPVQTSAFGRGLKNFKVHIKRYIAVSLVISIGMLAFLLSLSFGNVMDQSIEDFKKKNTAFSNGYIKGTDDGGILKYLNSDDRIENVYYQYKQSDISLSQGGKTEIMSEKFPTPKATEELSYGIMPRREMKEIAVTPSLAKKFDTNIKNLLGKELILESNGGRYALTISGIYNAEYDDFFVSSDIEQQFYSNSEQNNYSVSYDVKEFSDIVAVSNNLKLRGLTSENASDEVYALQNTFNQLNKLFFVISILILGIGLFICAVLLFKLQNTRYREVGLLSALGFSRNQISSMISAENMLVCALATGVNITLLGCSTLFSSLLDLPFIITGTQIGLGVIATFGVIMLLSGAASYQLVRTAPAAALKK